MSAINYPAHTAEQLFAELTVHDSRETIKRTLAAARELLGIDAVYLSTAQSGVDREDEAPMPPPRHNGHTGPLSIPLRFSDGRLYGTLECGSCEPGRSLSRRDVAFMQVLARIVSDQLEREELELDRQRERFEAMGLRAVLAAIEARDSYTGEHCRKVVSLSLAVGRELRLDKSELEKLGQIAILHDVGKLGVPDELLRKPGPLAPDEREVVNRHPVAGERLVRSIHGLAHLAPAVRAGHERWDGSGYPDGLSGELIPLRSRITFVCDAYDAMTSDRPYRASLGDACARLEVAANAGTQFCPRSAGALLQALERRRDAVSVLSAAAG